MASRSGKAEKFNGDFLRLEVL